jgi:hypothetical protein
MKEKKNIRAIQIPLWMDAAVSELAVKDKRNVSGEIEFLVESAIKGFGTGVRRAEPEQSVADAETVGIGR